MTGFIFGPNTYNLTPDPETGTYPDDGVLANPLEVIDRYDFTQEITRYIGSAQLNATPLSGLSIDYTLGIDTYDQTAIAFIPAGTKRVPPISFQIRTSGKMAHFKTSFQTSNCGPP
ncbi:MAG: hypothetical protein OXN20_21895 [Gemmatimonadota bacterium]|nr:hypothetical protein [Gemmatimonadota bacterium]